MRSEIEVLKLLKNHLQNTRVFNYGLCAAAYYLRDRGFITYGEEMRFKERIEREIKRRERVGIVMYDPRNQPDEEGPYIWKLGTKAPRTRWLNKTIKELT